MADRWSPRLVVQRISLPAARGALSFLLSASAGTLAKSQRSVRDATPEAANNGAVRGVPARRPPEGGGHSGFGGCRVGCSPPGSSDFVYG